MALYPTVPLRDVCEAVEYGYTASATTEAIGPRFLRITDIVPEQLEWERVPFCEIEPEKLSKYRLRSGDIVIARTGATTGWARFIKNPPEAVFASYLVRIRLRASVDSRFAGFVIESRAYKDFIQQHMGGAAQPNANAQVLTSYKIVLPPLRVQRRIAGILSAYDDLIENNQRRIQILEEMACSLYREWFVRFRFSGRQAVSFVESRLGKIPKGWQGRFGDLAILSRDGINPSDFPGEQFEHYSIPAYDESRQPQTELGETILSGKYCIDNTAVLLSKLNPRIPRIWLPFVSGDKRAITSTEFLVLQPKPGVTREFIYAKCASEEFCGQFASLAIGTSTSHQRVKPESLMAMPSIVPDPAVIERFTNLVAPMLMMCHALRTTIENLRRTRDLLLPRLLSGLITFDDLPVVQEQPDSLLSGKTGDVPAHSHSVPSLRSRSEHDVRGTATRSVISKPPAVITKALNGHEERPVPISETERNDVLAVIRQIFSDGKLRDRDSAICEVARALGYRRTGSAILDVVNRDLLTAVRRGILENYSGELRLQSRSIEDYERSFLKEQFLAAIGRTWIERDQAIRELARWLGFARTGTLIEDTARSLINGLLREERIETDGPDLIRRI